MSTALNNNSVDYDKVSQIYDISRAANVETIEKLIIVLHVENDSWLIVDCTPMIGQQRLGESGEVILYSPHYRVF